ncbi:hypothetical protein WJM93_15965 [Lactiplantibacillus plantarum]|uniref:hypothetical protein n=1 Tax=Lactiplantibacillus plantarum TaxID=1590 RepID=UPI0030AADB5D
MLSRLLTLIVVGTSIGIFSSNVEARAYSTPPRGILGPEPGSAMGAHDHSGIYHDSCPVGTHGGYIGGGNYYCHP